MDDVKTLGEASNFAHTLVKAIAGGPSAYTLAGLTLVSVASLAFLESSLVLKTFMIGVALVIIYSILVISLKGRGSTHDSDIQKSLPVVSDKPEQSMPHTQSTTGIELPGLVQLKKPEPVTDATERAVPELRTTPLIDDLAENSEKTPIQACTLREKDSVECELNVAAAAMAEARPHATSVQEHVTNDEQKTQTKGVSTATVAAKEVMPSPLTGNVPIAAPTEALGIKTIPVTKTGATSSETATQKNLQNKPRKVFFWRGRNSFPASHEDVGYHPPVRAH